MRVLAAALACRVRGSRLYGKPLQALDVERGTTVLDQLIALLLRVSPIDHVVLGIAEGNENFPFLEVAARHHVRYVVGSERDVLRRLIDCGRLVRATDIFRVTSECPFIYFEAIASAWEQHVSHANDVTVIDGLPEGGFFEIYRLAALEVSHERGDERDRSELCSRYIVNHRDAFRVEILDPPLSLQRLDLRLTVDFPEDLVVCRRVYEAFRDQAPLVSIEDAIRFLDVHPELVRLIQPYVHPFRVWN